MTPPRTAVIYPWPVRAYRWMTAVYPPAFHSTFADSMAADFNDALRDARHTGRTRGVLVLLAAVAADLIWSITVQWMRTSVPWLTAAYATALVGICEGLAATLVGSAFQWSRVVMLLPLVSAITFTLWFLVPQLRHRRSKTPCLTSAA
ncbi:MAG TPA: hypothetical protein PKW63_05705 [Vicinamibacterales bacterium]|nr:hypothetical protein [Vicinamibacterales bacterium]